MNEEIGNAVEDEDSTAISASRPPIALRVSTSILERLERAPSSSLQITQASCKSGDAHAFLQEGEKQTGLVIRSETIPTTQLVMATKGNNAVSSLGTCSKRFTLTTSVLAIGKRTRERLQEEQGKRREVVQLELQPPIPEEPTKKRPRPTATPQPDPSLLQPEEELVEKEERSGVVLVRGVDFGSCTPEHIRKFFSGLRPDRIVCLPGKNTVYIYVKFESYPVALAATRRSGESLKVARKSYQIDATLVQKQRANYVLRYLAVDVLPKQTFKETQEDLSDRLLPGVTSILRTATIRELQWAPWRDDGGSIMKADDAHINLSTHEGLKQLKYFHDSLVDEWDRMDQHGTCFQMFAFDPQLVNCDSAVRLNNIACKYLCEEIERLKDMLHRARQKAS